MDLVLFDFGGTLDADGLPWKERFHRLCQAEGIDVPADRFDPVFYAADDALVGAIPDTLSLDETVDRLAAGLVRELAPGDPALAARLARGFLASVDAQIAVNRPVLERLASRYRLGIVSNFYGNLPSVCDNLGIRPLFDVIVDSTQAGLSKPDPRLFRRAADVVGVRPASATVVGDSLARDMAGARAAGMPHIWLAGSGADRSRVCCPGDRVAETLVDVEPLLG